VNTELRVYSWAAARSFDSSSAVSSRRGGKLADVLGHRSLDTTALYTKVDLPRLRDVARPWPEEVVS
jgi:site-specific recombinase XerC